MSTKKIHFIAIGGNVMHNLAIDAAQKGCQVTGSDDEIYEPSRGRLAQAQLLPAEVGWFPEKITQDLNAIIVGMHARKDNPELLRAQELGLQILSFPQYIYQQSEDKQRIVITGSHGKTTITAMVMHVLRQLGRKFDYVIGSQVVGFEHLVRLSADAPTIIIEGDEYFAAPFDPTPKFLHYQHHIGLISGIAWDHMNVYPTFEAYVDPFEQFADNTPKAGALVYSQDDSIASVIGANEREDIIQVGYQAHPHKIVDGITYLTFKGDRIKVQFFGEHNLKNVSGAKAICTRMSIADEDFYKAISSFKGASRRLERIAEQSDFTLFKDYAHSPSKVLATTAAVKKQFVERKLIACFELHTYSSLNKDFLPQYRDSLNAADKAFVFYNPEAVAIKKMPELTPEDIAEAFDHDNLQVFNDIAVLKAHLLTINWHNRNLLMMTSGSFNNLDWNTLGQDILAKL